ncbi:MAG TPA: DEAD/DEAH box helicase [Vicinamibacterales bacterium]|nr:DEAD/DEAH box helicase [Vicinamibacterales bacterium]
MWVKPFKRLTVMDQSDVRPLGGQSVLSQDRRFSSLFREATGTDGPLPYQKGLALCDSLPSLVDVPTGLGKTAAAVLSWVWRRRFDSDAVRMCTPRRLVYCLPMRVLVEQTHHVTVEWLKLLGLYAQESQELNSDWSRPDGDLGGSPIAVHLLLGGEEKSDWALWPERDAILIGTQDMLLSRALNRGYAAGRARWPLEFGLLNNDCLWVFDEIQLMDTGLATSLQLDAWRRCLRLRSSRSEFPEEESNHVPRPCHSLWMSATMARHWLERAVDWSPRAAMEWNNRHQLSETERADSELRSGQLFQIAKQLAPEPIARLEKPKTKESRADKADADRKQADYLKQLAEHIWKAPDHVPAGLTLVIVNTVDRATKLFELLKKQPGVRQVPIKLIHSRFRPHERREWRDFLNRRDVSPRILISTQVVEAGVDLSARVLYTELAPWASLVQRFGRCARYPGDSGRIIWLDLDLGTDKQPIDHWAKPYQRAELVAAREKLASLTDVGLMSLTTIKAETDAEPGSAEATILFPYEPRFVPRAKDLFDLFDTTPDLTGADVDISRYIRDGEEIDVQVFWREVPDGGRPAKKDRPHRDELCPVPFHRFRELLPVFRQAGRVWRRDYRKGWEPVDSRGEDHVYPGQVFLLEKSCGGYSPELGWTGDPRDTDFELLPPIEPTKASVQDEEEDADDLSQMNQWLTILDHTRDVCRKLEEILDPTGLNASEIAVLRLAARWHDRGKAHPAFQAKLKPQMLMASDVQTRLAGQPAAKAPDGRSPGPGAQYPDESKNAWRKDKLKADTEGDHRRPGFRHELASALAILQTLYCARPSHEAFAWPDGLKKADFGEEPTDAPAMVVADHALINELAALSPDELDLLVYLVAAHHGKVRMSLRSSPDDTRADVPDPCPPEVQQARGVREDDTLPACLIPAVNLESGVVTPEVTLSLDLMELGLSPLYGASWRERTQLLLERFGPFRLAYLEAVLRAADCRASAEEDEASAMTENGV